MFLEDRNPEFQMLKSRVGWAEFSAGGSGVEEVSFVFILVVHRQGLGFPTGCQLLAPRGHHIPSTWLPSIFKPTMAH